LKLVEYLAVAVASLAVAVSLLRHRLMRDWRAWLVPASLAMLALALFQGVVGPSRGLGRLGDTGWLRSAAALVCALTAFLIAVVLDRLVEEKERAHQSSRIREQWLRMLTGRLPAVVWTSDRQQTITSHTGGGHRHVGIRPNEYIGRTLDAYFGGTDAAAPARRASSAALDGESLAFEVDWNGEPHEGFVEPIYDVGGRITGAIGFLLNSTDEIYGSASALEAQSLLRLVSAHVPIVMWSTDVGGRIVYAGGAGATHFDCDLADLVGSTPRQALATYGRDDAGIDAHRRALCGEAVEYRAGIDGRTITCHVQPRRNGRGKIVGAVGVAFEKSER
jgi:PAS domain-containing protein